MDAFANVSEVVIYDEHTKEVLACVPLNDRDVALLKKGINFRLYNQGTEPMFKNNDGKVMLNENAMLYKEY